MLALFILAISTKILFVLMAAAAFISFISFIQINSASSDKRKLHTFWKVMGIVFALVTAFLLYLVIQQAGAPAQVK